ncbi:hypothetical protein [Embleya sp. NPDC050493]|uniref:hypothetical protein n=1 Tax=Embleya sp. NPDC050493 TaxID=3363989 RepID=UPI00379EFD8F
MVEQLRPGGDLVFPWGRLGHFAVTVAEGGRSATGWLQGLAQFMPARDTTPIREFDEVEAAWDVWDRDGRIRRWDHGVTITADEQFVWAGDAATGRRWPLVTTSEPVAGCRRVTVFARRGGR